MPELPEVETIRRDLEKHLKNIEIVGVVVNTPKIVLNEEEKYKKSLVGNKITEFKRKGKFLYFKLDNGEFLVIHLKMTGQLIYKDSEKINFGGHSLGEIDKTMPNKHTHIIFIFKNGGKLFFNCLRKFAYSSVFDIKKMEEVLLRIGDDIYEESFTLEKFASFFKKTDKNIKGFLLDQTKFSGVGNIYADEICFDSKILPYRKLRHISEKEIQELFKSLKKIINLAVEMRGTTFNNYRDGFGNKGNFVNELKVYGRGKKNCFICEETLEKIKLNGRGTVYCKNCQK
jgi:formamidopyrimidine-DNA glycosylase